MYRQVDVPRSFRGMWPVAVVRAGLAPSILTMLACTTLVLGGCAGLTGPGDSGPPAEITDLPRSLSVGEEALIGAGNAFGFDLLRELVQSEPDSSHFISPLSASMALGMTMNGAAGETFDAMRSALRFGGLSQDQINASYRSLLDLLTELDPAVSVQIANSIWHADWLTPLEAFTARTRSAFDAEVRPIDFFAPDAAPTINAWVSEHTRGRIEEMVEDPIPNPEALVMYLLNAVHFEADWTAGFDRADTFDGPFQLPDGSVATVRYMERTGGFGMRQAPDYVVVDLPYGGKAFSMTVVVPRGSLTLPELVASMDDETWQSLVADLHDADRAGLQLPRFTLEREHGLNEPLARMGMGIAFRRCVADFSSAFGREFQEAACPHISAVKQKTFLRVDEEGTEAAAVTSVEIVLTSAPPIIRVDRPFLMAIRERLTGTILFLGAISEAPTD